MMKKMTSTQSAILEIIQNDFADIEFTSRDIQYNGKSASGGAGKSAFANVDEKAEWCCEAYMETDYDDLCDDSFSAIIKRSLAAAIKEEI